MAKICTIWPHIAAQRLGFGRFQLIMILSRVARDARSFWCFDCSPIRHLLSAFSTRFLLKKKTRKMKNSFFFFRFQWKGFFCGGPQNCDSKIAKPKLGGRSVTRLCYFLKNLWKNLFTKLSQLLWAALKSVNLQVDTIVASFCCHFGKKLGYF